MTLRPTKLMVFGNAKGGTPVVVAEPGNAIDLPLNLLIWRTRTTACGCRTTSPSYLQERRDFPVELLPNLAIVEELAAGVSE